MKPMIFTSINRCSLLSLTLCLGLNVVCGFTPNLSQASDEARYNDFYKRKIALQRQAEERELGRIKHIEDQKKAEEKFQKLEAEFVQKKKDQNQELKDQFAEKWMEEQTALHEEKLERARVEYLSKIKKNSKNQIPESEEFEVQ